MIFDTKSTSVIFVLFCLFCFNGRPGETGVGVESLARERPIGWDIAHVRDQFPDLLPSSSAQVHC